MRKADVTIRKEHGRAIPVVNVKHYGPAAVGTTPLNAVARVVLGDNPGCEDPDLPFLAWLRDASTDTQRSTAWEWTISDGWDRLQDRAIEIYGQGVRVVSYGRSGGWASITLDGDRRRIPDVDRWNAIDLVRWWRFMGAARAIVGDLDYQYLTNLLINMYEAEAEGIREACIRDRRRTVLREHAIAACVAG